MLRIFCTGSAVSRPGPRYSPHHSIIPSLLLGTCQPNCLDRNLKICKPSIQFSHSNQRAVMRTSEVFISTFEDWLPAVSFLSPSVNEVSRKCSQHSEKGRKHSNIGMHINKDHPCFEDLIKPNRLQMIM